MNFIILTDWTNYGCAGEGFFDCSTPIYGKQVDEWDRDFFQWKKCIQCTMSGASSSVWQNPSGQVPKNFDGQKNRIKQVSQYPTFKNPFEPLYILKSSHQTTFFSLIISNAVSKCSTVSKTFDPKLTMSLDGEDEEDGTPNVAKAICECDWRLIQAWDETCPNGSLQTFQSGQNHLQA